MHKPWPIALASAFLACGGSDSSGGGPSSLSDCIRGVWLALPPFPCGCTPDGALGTPECAASDCVMSSALVVGQKASEDQDLRFVFRRTATGHTLSVVGGALTINRAKWQVDVSGNFIETPIPLGTKTMHAAKCEGNALTLVGSAGHERATPGLSSAILSAWDNESWTAVSYSP